VIEENYHDYMQGTGDLLGLEEDNSKPSTGDDLLSMQSPATGSMGGG